MHYRKNNLSFLAFFSAEIKSVTIAATKSLLRNAANPTQSRKDFLSLRGIGLSRRARLRDNVKIRRYAKTYSPRVVTHFKQVGLRNPHIGTQRRRGLREFYAAIYNERCVDTLQIQRNVSYLRRTSGIVRCLASYKDKDSKSWACLMEAPKLKAPKSRISELVK